MIALQRLSEVAEKAFKKYFMFTLRRFLFDLNIKKPLKNAVVFYSGNSFREITT